jgi:hypothetical protein
VVFPGILAVALWTARTQCFRFSPGR